MKWWPASGQTAAQKACLANFREQLLLLAEVSPGLVVVAWEAQMTGDRSAEGEDMAVDAQAVCAPSGVRE